MTRKKQALEALKIAGSKGLTVKESMSLNIGTEFRRCVTDLIREGHNITTKWEYNKGKKYKRYFLNYKPPVYKFDVVPQMPKTDLPDTLEELRQAYKEAKKRGDKLEMARIKAKGLGLKTNLPEQVKKYLY